MSLLLVAGDRKLESWKKALQQTDPDLDVEIWPDVKNRDRVQFMVSWNHPKGMLNRFPNLKAVSSLGAGVDHILRDPDLPDDLWVCRVVTPSLIRQMKEYVLHAVLSYQRNFTVYARQKQMNRWSVHENRPHDSLKIGVMGLGEFGRPVAECLSDNGYQVAGWSRSVKSLEGISHFAGENDFDEFLKSTNLLICMLPLTKETAGILNLELMKKLIRPAYLINVARGEHLVDEDLIYALDKGWLSGAWLDVFNEEPLPENHPFWNRPNIMITPHVASVTRPAEAAEQIVENYKRVISGIPPLNRVDREKGY
ncbi:MAG: glyoxylate/hydroxypyruvate reductase A [Balneolaceae bacterium]|nr:glyoxylate/hydroxypyruvate reductase A [Balneolaceae bacterium]